MSRSKENASLEARSDFIRYLYREGERKGIHRNPDFYSSIISFVNSPEGQSSLDKFLAIDPHLLGIDAPQKIKIIKRVFQS